MASVGFLGGARMQAEKKKRIYPPKIETEQKKAARCPRIPDDIY